MRRERLNVMKKGSMRLLALALAAALLLSGCASSGGEAGSKGLTWVTWRGYEKFIELLEETYPDIGLEQISYTGNSATSYNWAQMRAGDISDIFTTSQILDRDLAAEQLLDLSGYDFINDFPTSTLDQVAIDGKVYLLPINYAMYGIFYNKTLLEENHWEVPENFQELEALCGKIREAGMVPGVLGTHLTGNTFSAMFNLAKTSWLTTPEGAKWEQGFLAGDATAAGMWEDTVDYARQYMDIGMFATDPEDRNNPDVLLDYLGNRKSVFCTAVFTVNITELPETGDKLGMMPYISKDGSKNVYMYNPTSYIGISKRLAEPGNEKKLEDAVKLLSLLFSPEGQASFITEETPCVLGALSSAQVPEDSMIYDAQQAMQEGRAFPMTYAGWENVLADIGLAYKEWFRGENNTDGEGCIARMDELQRDYLDSAGQVYFSESTADFTLEETAALIGKALGSKTGADASMVLMGEYHRDVPVMRAGVTGKLYAGRINTDVAASISPDFDGEYALLSMTGKEAKAFKEAGFTPEGESQPYPYVLVTKGGAELRDEETYQIAFLKGSYTEEAAGAYGAQVLEGSAGGMLREYLEEQKTVSPDSPWE